MHISTLTLKTRLLLEHNGKILLLKQTNKNGGKFTLVGGSVEKYELVKPALVRESMEEAGIELKAKHLKLVHTLLKKKDEHHTRIVLYFKALAWGGHVESREPKKFKKTVWHPLDNLPENMSPTVRHFLKQYKIGNPYSEFEKKATKANQPKSGFPRYNK